MSSTAVYMLSAAVVVVAFFCGGGSHAGFLGDVLVQILATPLLIGAGAMWLASPQGLELARRSDGVLLLIASAVFVCILVLQLLPLPATWFGERYPGVLVQNGGVRPAWSQLSLAPAATWAAAASAIPVFAVFAGVSQLDAAMRMKLAAVVLGLGTIALVLGFLQVAQGPQSGLRFYAFTNPSEAVGFFANRNHYAAQLYTVLIFAAVWFTFQARTLARHRAHDSRAYLWFAAAAALLLATMAGLAMARSRAGVFLTMAAIGGIVAIVFTGGLREAHGGNGASASAGRRLALLMLGFAVLFAVLFGLERVLTRFEADPLDDLRMALTPRTLQLAIENLPFGAGLGSFVQVYAASERTNDLFSGYANRAHNDWAEFLLETGLFGIAIAALFLTWFSKRTVEVWRGWRSHDPTPHAMMQRAATLAIALLLAHSLVDYPLRTTAIATLFAFACAMLIEPPQPKLAAAEPVASSRGKRSRRRSHGMAPPSAPLPDQDWSHAWVQGEQSAAEHKDLGGSCKGPDGSRF